MLPVMSHWPPFPGLSAIYSSPGYQFCNNAVPVVEQVIVNREVDLELMQAKLVLGEV